MTNIQIQQKNEEFLESVGLKDAPSVYLTLINAGRNLERERFVQQIRIAVSLYAGFYPEIANAIIALLATIDPDEEQRIKDMLGGNK